ncbi:MAG: hypothetical protein J6N72_05285, partial [Psychrobacter sp.]|nr:hypothetical protein [Psychrobacter sp.]
MKKYEYLALIEAIFSKNGALVKAGGRYNQQQQEYALHIASGLSRNEAVVLAEADTGTGKSVGYLIPSLVHLANNPKSKPIVISTHTRALQRQLLEKDVILAESALREAGLKPPVIAFRMGRHAFFSPTRVQDAVDSLPKGLAEDSHTALIEFANTSVITGSGLWMDYINIYGSFPNGITADDICLLDLMDSDNPAYTRHIEDAKIAQLLITNHATIMSRKVFKEGQFYALICDEAHEIEDVCIGLSTYKSQLKRISSAVSAALSNSKAAKNAIEISANIEGRLREFDNNQNKKHNLISDISNADLLNELQVDIVNLNKSLTSCRSSYVKKLDKAPSISEARVVDRLDRHIETLSSFERGAVMSKRRAIAFSPTLRESSVAAISLNAGMLFNWQASKLTKRILLVSATMSNANTKTVSFTHIMGSLGIKEERVTDTCSIAPIKFGAMSFVVIPSGKSPVLNSGENEASLDESWLKTTAKMIDTAALTGKTLVLSPSLKESQLLANKINATYLLQDQNNPLMQLTNAFIKGEEQVLLSAGAWNGVSFRNSDGGQLLENLFITRIPFLPMDPELDFLQTEYLLSKGYTMPAI